MRAAAWPTLGAARRGRRRVDFVSTHSDRVVEAVVLRPTALPLKPTDVRLPQEHRVALAAHVISISSPRVRGCFNHAAHFAAS